MAGKSRRDFLKKSAVIGAGVTGLSTSSAKAEPKNILSEDRMGVLVDMNVCVGCRNCEWACKKTNDLSTKPQEKYKSCLAFAHKFRLDFTRNNFYKFSEYHVSGVLNSQQGMVQFNIIVH